MENTSISSNIAYWKNEIDATKKMRDEAYKNLYVKPRAYNKTINYEQLVAEVCNLNYELREMEKNHDFWLWVDNNFGEGYRETFSHPMEDDE